MAVKALPITLDKDDSDNDMEDTEWYNQSGKLDFTTYTKHYYIGSERIASSLDTMRNLGVLCEENAMNIAPEDIDEMDIRTQEAHDQLISTITDFDKHMTLPPPHFYYGTHLINCGQFQPYTNNNYAAYWFHPDHLGSSSYITSLQGEISQHMEYFPFGETLVEEHKNSNNSPYKFNGKELDDETGNYYYGARYYNPKWSFWLSVDPLAEKYPGWSPYNYTLLNPVKLVDPDGRSVDWKPVMHDDGSTSYEKEKGDNASTLQSQYGLSKEEAEQLYSNMENGEISGQEVYNTTGNEVMKLDLNSDQATDQRIFDQYLFASDHSKSQDAWAFLSTDYFNNTEYKDMLRGRATVTAEDKKFEVYYRIPVYRSATFDGSSTAVGISNEPYTIRQRPGSLFGSKQENIRAKMYHPDTGNVMGEYDISIYGPNSKKFYRRMHQEFPKNNYIRTPNKTHEK